MVIILKINGNENLQSAFDRIKHFEKYVSVVINVKDNTQNVNLRSVTHAKSEECYRRFTLCIPIMNYSLCVDIAFYQRPIMS